MRRGQPLDWLDTPYLGPSPGSVCGLEMVGTTSRLLDD